MTVVLALLVAAAVAVALGVTVVNVGWLRRRGPRSPGAGRMLFPITGDGFSGPALETALQLARAEQATLVPAYLARVPFILPLDSPVPREVERALPLLEAIERRAARAGVANEARIERGRTVRHALGELLAHERHDRVVIAAGPGVGGLSASDIAWLLDHGDDEVLILRPAGASTTPVAPDLGSSTRRRPTVGIRRQPRRPGTSPVRARRS